MSDAVQEPLFRNARAGRIASFSRLDIVKRLAVAPCEFFATVLAANRQPLVNRRKASSASRCRGYENG